MLLAADGISTEIADRVGVSRLVMAGGPVASWGCGGWRMSDARAGRGVDRAKILAATLTPPPAGLGVTHWSAVVGREFGGGCLHGAADLAASPGAAVAGGDV